MNDDEQKERKLKFDCQGNHTSYLDYILLSAHRFPHAVVMARHTGALGNLLDLLLFFLM